MINLDAGSKLAKWFVWSCDRLPFTVTRIYDEDGKDWGRRKGASYLASGTTLCHIFWATLWVPIALAAFSSFCVFFLTVVHVLLHEDFIKAHPDAGPLASIASYFMLEGFMLGMAAAVGILILSIIGGSKVGFFNLLWQHLKGIKQRICPLVRFGNTKEPACE